MQKKVCIINGGVLKTILTLSYEPSHSSSTIELATAIETYNPPDYENSELSITLRALTSHQNAFPLTNTRLYTLFLE